MGGYRDTEDNRQDLPFFCSRSAEDKLPQSPITFREETARMAKCEAFANGRMEWLGYQKGGGRGRMVPGWLSSYLRENPQCVEGPGLDAAGGGR